MGNLGKSQQVLEILKLIPFNLKVMYAGSDHELLNELVQKFNKVPYEFGKQHSMAAHIKGKEQLCENKPVLKKYKEAGIPIPHEQCELDCPFYSGCPYVDQFDTIANIRFFAKQELFNHKAYFDKYFELPDLIIIDENWISLNDDSDFYEDLNNKWKSLRDIMLFCADKEQVNRQVIIEAIKTNRDQITEDYFQMERERDKHNRKIPFKNADQHIQHTLNRQSTWSKSRQRLSLIMRFWNAKML